ncbi:MAG: hypothetical protein WBH75_06340 [Thermoanaerobaculia bacterium]
MTTPPPSSGYDQPVAKPTVMLIGLGHLGGALLELLARDTTLGRLMACSRRPERGEARCNLARLGATAQGFAPQIDYLPLDLENTAQTAELIDRVAPDLVLSTATLQTWWLTDLLPSEPAAALKKAGFGGWLPVHLPLTLKLMRALQEADYPGVVLTAPFPDVVNTILERIDLAPTCGIGNIDEMVPKVRLLAAERLGASPFEVRVTLVAHHALQPMVFGTRAAKVPPYYLRVHHQDRDVTEEVAADELLLAPYPLPHGPAWSWLTAGSAARLVPAILADEETHLHAPAPGGLPGGYPVVVGRGEARPDEIEGLSLEEAIAINESSHRFDGIEAIEADGTTVFTPDTTEVMRRELGFDCRRLVPEEAADRGRELIQRFDDYARRHGVDLSRAM